MDYLSHLAQYYGTDKYGIHRYTPYYSQIFYHRKVRTILEIGVLNGASLRMWKDYFPLAFILGIDINSHLSGEARIKCFQADQRDSAKLEQIAKEYGPFDIVIDDASHEPEDQAFTANVLIPYVRPGGFYIIEDVREGNKEQVQAAIKFPTRVVEFEIERQTDDRLIICER